MFFKSHGNSKWVTYLYKCSSTKRKKNKRVVHKGRFATLVSLIFPQMNNVVDLTSYITVGLKIRKKCNLWKPNCWTQRLKRTFKKKLFEWSHSEGKEDMII